MTDQEFDLGYMNDPIKAKDGRRLRTIVSEELTRQARITRQAGRPDRASRCAWAAGRLYAGQPITKRVDRMISKEREAARRALVDGADLVDWSKVE
jgi:hypothetical protein